MFSCDFETTTTPDDCRVWLWGILDLDDTDGMVEYGLTIEQFIEKISYANTTAYFHNLKFDSGFILDWLLKNGYQHTTVDSHKLLPGTFTTLISDMNRFYSITVKWRNGRVTEFRDSLKKLVMSVERVAKAFKLEMSKGDIDYHLPRSVGYEPTPAELDYLDRDVRIMAKAMRELLDEGMTRLTTGADSLAEYKFLTGQKLFYRRFPVLSHTMDAEIRRAYRGGFTYADPRHMGKITRSGIVLDVNSLYPSVMFYNELPYGMPMFVEGKVTPTRERPLTIFSVTITAKLKPNHIPCIQIKGSAVFGSTEYIREIKEPTEIMVTNVDWELYNEHYDIDVLAWGGGWAFKAGAGMFDDYINKWSRVKETSEGGRREMAKLHLNSLYGKFASNPRVTGKIPTLEDDRVKLVRGAEELTNPIYTAVGVFVTSYARALTVRAAQQNYGTFAYADTDSLHLLTDEIPGTLDVHDSRMGAWAFEYAFQRAYFVRPKAYLEQLHDGSYHNAWAGLHESVSRNLTFDDLVDGRVIEKGKLSPRYVPGGVVLEDVKYTMQL